MKTFDHIPMGEDGLQEVYGWLDEFVAENGHQALEMAPESVVAVAHDNRLVGKRRDLIVFEAEAQRPFRQFGRHAHMGFWSYFEEQYSPGGTTFFPFLALGLFGIGMIVYKRPKIGMPFRYWWK